MKKKKEKRNLVCEGANVPQDYKEAEKQSCIQKECYVLEEKLQS
jgi:hypothetical protein